MTERQENIPDEFSEDLELTTTRVTEAIRNALDARLAAWKTDFAQREVHEVVGALLARQTTLAEQMILSPRIWNEHVAPLVLRCMADVYISLAWILLDPVERSQKFIVYGLGQEKLLCEHRQEQLRRDGKDPTQDPGIRAQEAWIDAQQFTFLTEVNVGSWSGIDTRKMAEEAKCLDFYRYVYSPFSPAVHSTWNHICRFNTQECTNPLHLHHRRAVAWELSLSLEYFLLPVKYVQKTFRLFDEHITLSVEAANLLDLTHELLSEIAEKRTDNSETTYAPNRDEGPPPAKGSVPPVA